MCDRACTQGVRAEGASLDRTYKGSSVGPTGHTASKLRRVFVRATLLEVMWPATHLLHSFAQQRIRVDGDVVPVLVNICDNKVCRRRIKLPAYGSVDPVPALGCRDGKPTLTAAGQWVCGGEGIGSGGG